MPEARKHPRWALTLEVSYKVRGGGGGGMAKLSKLFVRSNKSRSQDISLGGMSLKAQESMAARTLLDLTIQLPASHTEATAVAEVIRCVPEPQGGGFLVGARFLEVGAETDEVLDEALKQQLDLVKGSPPERIAELKRKFAERLLGSLLQAERLRQKG